MRAVFANNPQQISVENGPIFTIAQKAYINVVNLHTVFRNFLLNELAKNNQGLYVGKKYSEFLFITLQ